jgi:beta-glucanase (GH16 family)
MSSRDQYLFGRFEATIQASNVPGVVTGFFLHRNSPRQEIDIEIAGNRPDRLVVNVFYNPGDEGAKFDYGYRGAPSYIDLGFDASRASHRFAIEWSPNEILWWVDDRLVHRRVIWDPTPIPHLPMSLHVNSWPTRSAQLAGRLNDRRLPAITIVGPIIVEANAVTCSAGSDDLHQAQDQLLEVSRIAQ